MGKENQDIRKEGNIETLKDEIEKREEKRERINNKP